MARFKLLLLGSFQASYDGQPVRFRTTQVQALLIYLVTEDCLQPGGVQQREALMELLWPRMPLKSAQHNLRQTLYQLRRLIPKRSKNPILKSDRKSIHLNPDFEIESDLLRFRGLIKSQNRNPDALKQAAVLIRGDFLADFFLPDSENFEAWAAKKRAYWRRLALECLTLLTLQYLENSQYRKAKQIARQMLDLEPLNEQAVRLLLIALAQSGQRTAALVQYDSFKQRLAGELGVEPSAETKVLYQQIQADAFDVSPTVMLPSIFPTEKLEPPTIHAHELISPLSPEAKAITALKHYHRQTIASLSDGRYQLDSRFVKLTLLLDQGPEAQGLRFVEDDKQRQFNNLEELLDTIEEQAVVILGEPGSGKTTLLRRLQHDLAQAALLGDQEQSVLFAPLNSFRALQSSQAIPEPMNWLAEMWQKRYPNLPAFHMLFNQGKLHLLLDGLNEMPHRDKADYRERIGHWRYFLQETRRYGNRVIFSCRSLDYSAPLSSTAVPVRQVRVEPLSHSQIEAFLHTYLSEKGVAVWQQLKQEAKQLTLFANPFFLRLLVALIGKQGKLPTGKAALLTGFVRHALRREVNDQANLLFQPDNLLSEGDYEQVLHNEWLTPYELPWEGELFTQLENLAFVMQDGREDGQVRTLEKEALCLLDHPRARDIIQAGIQLNILDREVATRELSFSHQLIQEYFAARLLAQELDPDKVAVPWRADEFQPSLEETIASLEKSEPLPAAPTTGWEETAILAAAMSQDQDVFVHDLLLVNLPLAARCTAAPEVHISPKLVVEIQQALLARMEEPATDLRARIATAHSLWELGHPRYKLLNGQHGPYLRPPMVRIPSGTYPIGSDEVAAIDDEVAAKLARFENPAHMVDLVDFEIGVYPVTNAEYRLFLENGGYEDERWWLTEASRTWLKEGGHEGQKQQMRGWRSFWQHQTEDEILRLSPNAEEEDVRHFLWLHSVNDQEFEAWLIEEYPPGTPPREPHYWQDSSLNQPGQPVVGISWFEALAYCTWLTAQAGEIYDMPTEVEWEAAARGKEDRKFPFGNTFDRSHCNTFEIHIRRTTPVDVFPSGRTPEGISDLCGNIFEWTTTRWGTRFEKPDYLYPYNGNDGRENLEGANMWRIQRGGAFAFPQALARVTHRNLNPPTGRGSAIGFRLIRRSFVLEQK